MASTKKFMSANLQRVMAELMELDLLQVGILRWSTILVITNEQNAFRLLFII